MKADPRIAKRAAKVKADRKRRKLRILTYTLLTASAILAAGIWLVFFSPFLDVNKIRFNGTNQVSLEELRSITNDLKGDPIATINLDSTAHEIAELPWVESVKLNRSWFSGQVGVEIIERTPVAAARNASGYKLLGRQGRVLETIGNPLNYPVLEGIGTSGGWAQDSDQALEVAQSLSANQALSERVSSVVVADEIFLRLRDGGWVLLGDTRELSQKLHSTQTMLTQAGVACGQMLDVRTPLTPSISTTQCAV